MLIVEDDAVVADTLRVYLERAGYAVDTVARDGMHGVERGLRPEVALWSFSTGCCRA